MAPGLGDSPAREGVVEITDFQCPYCKRFHDQAFRQLKATYIETGKIQYFVRDFPLGFHGQAKGAAVAAHCAGEQGAYWPMYDELLTNQHHLGPDLNEELANSHQLGVPEFLICLENPEQAKAVEADLAYGQSIGVRGTPNFYIGRIQDGKLAGATRISGAQTFQRFQQVIDSLLQ